MPRPTSFYFVCFIFICLHKLMASRNPSPQGQEGQAVCRLLCRRTHETREHTRREMNSVRSELISDQTLNLAVSFLAPNIYFNSQAQPSTLDARNILTHSEKVLSSGSKKCQGKGQTWVLACPRQSPPSLWHVCTLCRRLTRDC